MPIDSTLCQLGRFLDEWTQDAASVRSVTVSEDESAAGGASAEVALDLPVARAGGQLVGCTPSVTAEGNLELNLETALSVTNTDGYVADVEPVDAEFRPDGTVTVSLAVSGIDERCERSTAGSDDAQFRDGPAHSESESTEAGAASETPEVPPFRNPDLLREVYEAHDTFAEMAESLEMDVTGETVRRYMIDHDIHQPNSYQSNGHSTDGATADRTGTDGATADRTGTDGTTVDGTATNGATASGTSTDGTTVDGTATNGTTASPSTAESTETGGQAVRPDGLGLPDGVTTEELIETVSRANTIYEVKEDLGMDRMEAHTMLKELDMVDLVLGRLSNDTSRDITREDVVERLQTVSQVQAH